MYICIDILRVDKGWRGCMVELGLLSVCNVDLILATQCPILGSIVFVCLGSRLHPFERDGFCVIIPINKQPQIIPSITVRSHLFNSNHPQYYKPQPNYILKRSQLSLKEKQFPYHPKLEYHLLIEFQSSNAKGRACKSSLTYTYTYTYTYIGLSTPYRLSSLSSMESGSSCCSCKFRGPNFLKTASEFQNITVHSVTQFSPSPVISCTQSLPQNSTISQITAANTDHDQSQSSNQSASSTVLRHVHVSDQLMEDFLELAKGNTNKDLETCGILGAFLKDGTFYVTTLIIPKQESTSSSCQAINEEEAFSIQNEHSLFPVGWIHTHPSQSCFMSSVDLHTHYSYQVMVPEAFAIVMAPTDTSRSYGFFRLSDPSSMSVVKECQEQGFHPHKETADGSPIYEHCSNVYTNTNLRFEIFDLR